VQNLGYLQKSRERRIHFLTNMQDRIWFIIWGVYTTQQTSSKLPADVQQTSSNSCVFWIHLLEVC